MKSLKILLVFINFFFLLTANAYEYQSINAGKLVTMMKLDNVVLLDLRTSGEVGKTGIIERAQVRDYYQQGFDQYIATLDKKKTYIVYCHSGGRSSSAVHKMVKIGLKAYDYSGGITEWMYKKNKTVMLTK
jgi:phage shock protein E